MKKRYILLLFAALFASRMKTMAQTAVPLTLLPTTDNPSMTISLDGTWRFRLLDGSEAQSFGTAWTQGDYDDKKWKNIAVPGCWETQGFCKAAYGRSVEERDGLYRTRFNCPAEWKRQGRQIMLRIEAASMSYRCCVNGHDVGSFGRAHMPCNFDITDHVVAGDNVVCIDVSSHGPSWLYDVVDNWSYCGINRSVSVFCVDKAHIADVTFRSDIEKGKANISLATQVVTDNRKGLRLTARLTNASGLTVWSTTAKADTAGMYIIKGVVERPRLWTAETPTLYNLEIDLRASDGQSLHRREIKVGLRDIRVEGPQLLVNGKPILLHGVCVSEAHPYLGAAYTKEEWRKQMLMMKQANVNFIRTAHYPMHPSLYDLADEMGFYVCSEVPFASRGAEYLQTDSCLDELYARADGTVMRDKNHPSVIMWSLGNENKTTMYDVATHVKNLDPTRPRGFPQTIGPLSQQLSKPHPDVNLLMGHYFNPARLKEVEDKATVPFVQTEYGHSLGLSMGDFEDRWQRIVSTPGFVGGSVWCWQDGATVTSKCPTNVCKGVWVDSLHYLDGYGYTNLPKGAFERGKEAIDGIVYADGRPQEDYYLVRKLYSPVQLLADTLAHNGSLTIANRNDFTALDGYTLHWRQTDYNETLGEGDVKLHAEARQTEQVQLPTLDARRGTMVEFTVSDPKGNVIHERTMPVGEGLDYAQLLKELPRDKQMKISVGREGTIRITHKRLGTLIDTKLCLRTGRKRTVTGEYRPGTKGRWNPYIVDPEIKGIERTKASTAILCRWRRGKSTSEYIDGRVELTELANGTLDICYTLHPSDSLKTSFTELGLVLKGDKRFDELRWIGRGPFASTPDKCRHSEPGLWALASSDYRFDGNRRDVGVCCLADEGTARLYMVPDGGNVGVERVDGCIAIGHNLWVSGIGSKFTTPSNMLRAADMATLKGHLIMKATAMWNEWPAWLRPIATMDNIEAECPYTESYGW